MADKKISQLTGASTPLAGTEVLPIVQSGSTVKVAVSDLTAGRAVTMAGSTLTFSGITGNVALNVPFPTASNAKSQLLFTGTGDYRQTVKLKLNKDQADNAPVDVIQFGPGVDVTVSAGNLVVGTAAKGIDFSANTGAAGMTSQLLNWYEEGTWTPVLSRSGGAVTVSYTTQVGSYVRVGKLVFIKFNITWTGLSGSSGYYKVTGLPFTMTSGMAFEVIPVIDIDGITFTAGYTQIGCEARQSTTELYVVQAGSNVTTATFTSGFAAAGTLIASGCYQID